MAKDLGTTIEKRDLNTELAKVDEAAQKTEEMVAAALEMIAEANYSPSIDRPWAGKLDVITRLTTEFKEITRDQAEVLIQSAIERLYSKQSIEKQIELSKMLFRLNGYRQAALKLIKEGTIHITEVYKLKPQKVPGTKNYAKDVSGRIIAESIPFKRVVRRGRDDIAAIRLILEIEKQFYEMQRLGTVAGLGGADVFEKFSRDADGEVESEVSFSISQRHMSKNLGELPAHAQELLKQAVAEQRKRVENREVEDAKGIPTP